MLNQKSFKSTARSAVAVSVLTGGVVSAAGLVNYDDKKGTGNGDKKGTSGGGSNINSGTRK
ncbi:MAG: uncharacterized protein KVP18_001611 [Porospora cf. gigantea A]|uniref:uncharacterized protein n=1 Tax=Porospora cf. gigantea A TaxID=2853593 RepID=UPI003559AAC1|nr:MAG: hypothetical protein KVP18_001611 [Porospora cf. gigantea A]